MLILSLSVAVSHMLITWWDELYPFDMAWQSQLLCKPSVHAGFATFDSVKKLEGKCIENRSSEDWNPELSLSSLSLYPSLESSPGLSILRVLSDWNRNVKEEKCWVEASAALLVFLLEIRLSADRPRLWRRWELRGCNISFFWYFKWSWN